MSRAVEIEGLDHLGQWVPDVDVAVEFYQRVLGYELVGRDVTPRHVGASARLQVGEGPALVVYELDPATDPWVTTGLLNTHAALYVGDMDAAVATVRAEGFGERSQILDAFGAEAGKSSTFFHYLSPWGQDLEFVSYPHPRAYEATTDLRMWHPSEVPAGGRVAGTVHAGLRVPDGDAAVHWLGAVFGAHQVYLLPSFRWHEGRWDDQVDADACRAGAEATGRHTAPGTHIRVAYVRAVASNIEVIQADAPAPDGGERSLFDAAAAERGSYLAFAAKDPDAAEAALVPWLRTDRTERPTRYLTPWGQAFDVVAAG